jgi:hypothetical protein
MTDWVWVAAGYALAATTWVGYVVWGLRGRDKGRA